MKFRFKITLCMLGLLSLLFGIGGSVLISLSFQSSLEREKEVAWHSYQLALRTLQIVNELEQPLDYGQMSHTLEQLCGQNAAFWAALRLETETETVYEMGMPTAIQIDAKRPLPGSCLFRYTSDESGARWLVLSGAIDAGGAPLYLHTVHDISALYEARNTQQRMFQWIFAGMALICAALSYTVSRVLTAPLDELSRASRAVASGHYSSRARIRSGDEIGAVSADFNAMTDQLEDVITELRSAVERQESFMGSFAHELKTPMTSIIGYADLLLSETLNKDEQAEAAKYIFTEGKRLESLSRKLLNLLVIQKSDMPLQLIHPADLIQTLIEQIKPVYLAQGISLSCRCEDGCCRLEPDLVRSLLLNLIDNARKAIEHSGSIAISSEMTEDGCRICVRDDGRGIPPEALSHLTEAFYRVDKSRSRAQGGVGLGLALCQEIVQFHGGALWFGSRPNEGTCVVAELKGGRE